MINQPGLIDIPRRNSLSAQAAASMRKAIAEGVWQEYLPSERRLCEVFLLSRPTVRAALHTLVREGLISIRQGKRIRVLNKQVKRTPERRRRLGLIMPESVTGMPLAVYHEVTEMRRFLEEQGFFTDILVCPAESVAIQRRKLEAFIEENQVLCCVLVSVSEKLQRWFVEHSVPALVMGSCHASVKLPSLDVDYRSVCRHAAGVLLAKGHRRIALVMPSSGAAGDLASEQGFLEGMKRHEPAAGVRSIVIRHNGAASNIAARLDAAFKSDQPPTALLVAKPIHVFAVLIYLANRGIAVPREVSLIARDSERAYSLMSPGIAHYRLEEGGSVRRLSRLILKLVNEGKLSATPNLIFPKFFEGGTVRSPAR